MRPKPLAEITAADRRRAWERLSDAVLRKRIRDIGLRDWFGWRVFRWRMWWRVVVRRDNAAAWAINPGELSIP